MEVIYSGSDPDFEDEKWEKCEVAEEQQKSKALAESENGM